METLVDEQADLESHPTLNVKPMQLPMHEIGDGWPVWQMEYEPSRRRARQIEACQSSASGTRSGEFSITEAVSVGFQ